MLLPRDLQVKLLLVRDLRVSRLAQCIVTVLELVIAATVRSASLAEKCKEGGTHAELRIERYNVQKTPQVDWNGTR